MHITILSSNEYFFFLETRLCVAMNHKIKHKRSRKIANNYTSTRMNMLQYPKVKHNQRPRQKRYKGRRIWGKCCGVEEGSLWMESDFRAHFFEAALFVFS